MPQTLPKDGGTPTTTKKKGPEDGWENKMCECCGMTPQQPTSADTTDGAKVRKWGRPNFWGPFCWWCTRAAGVRYAWMNSVAFQRFLTSSPENHQEGMLVSWAYVSLREEGRTQITTQMIEARLMLFRRMHTTMPSIFEKSHYQVTPLDEFYERRIADLGNPIEKGFEIVQISLAGQRRLAVRHPVPRCDRLPRTGGLSYVRMGDFVMTDSPADIQILQTIADQAPKQLLKCQVPDPADGGDDNGDRERAGMEADGEGMAATAPVASLASGISAEAIHYPKGRIGTGVQRNQNKLDSIVANLATPLWLDALKETTLRGLVRACAGLEKELIDSEFPAMIKLNQEHNDLVRHLLDLSLAATGMKKEDRASNFVKFKAPLDAIAEYKAAKFTGAAFADLDCELVLLKVPLGWWAPRSGPTCPHGYSSNPVISVRHLGGRKPLRNKARWVPFSRVSARRRSLTRCMWSSVSLFVNVVLSSDLAPLAHSGWGLLNWTYGSSIEHCRSRPLAGPRP